MAADESSTKSRRKWWEVALKSMRSSARRYEMSDNSSGNSTEEGIATIQSYEGSAANPNIERTQHDSESTSQTSILDQLENAEGESSDGDITIAFPDASTTRWDSCESADIGSDHVAHKFQLKRRHFVIVTIVAVILIAAVVSGILLSRNNIGQGSQPQASLAPSASPSILPTSSPLTDDCATPKKVSDELYMSIVGIQEDLNETEKEIIEEKVVGAYNTVSGNCSDMFKRKMIKAQLLEGLEVPAAEDGFLWLTSWLLTVACDGCPPDRPFFDDGSSQQLQGYSTINENDFVQALNLGLNASFSNGWFGGLGSGTPRILSVSSDPIEALPTAEPNLNSTSVVQQQAIPSPSPPPVPPPLSSPTDDCATPQKIFGELYISISGIEKDLNDTEKEIMETNVLDSYNAVSAGCSDLYKRKMAKARFFEGFQAQAVEDGFFWLTSWLLTVACNGCPPDQPFFDDNESGRQGVQEYGTIDKSDFIEALTLAMNDSFNKGWFGGPSNDAPAPIQILGVSLEPIEMLPSMMPSQSSISAVPSLQPSLEPSYMPSASQEERPRSNGPQDRPNALMSELPVLDSQSFLPSSSPSSATVSDAPSQGPTHFESESPSLERFWSDIPSASSDPSASPTIYQTQSWIPTQDPSTQPSNSFPPSGQTSEAPSSSAAPSYAPSRVPTNIPFLDNGGIGSPSASQKPSRSAMPSESARSASPSESASANPSETVSASPSESQSPTVYATGSRIPAREPSTQPSNSFAPSGQTSQSPSSSAAPSYVPSRLPTKIPIHDGGGIDSDRPSPSPESSSALPSESAIPTTVPTLRSTWSRIPSNSPSQKVSLTPSVAPSYPQTSSIETMSPTASFATSKVPSASPSGKIVVADASSKSSRSTGAPSDKSSASPISQYISPKSASGACITNCNFNLTCIDFSVSGDGKSLGHGDSVKYEWLSAYGMTVTAASDLGGYTPDGRIRIFDTSHQASNSSVSNPILGSPNEKCDPPGPGIGLGGEPGQSGENCSPQGNVLVFREKTATPVGNVSDSCTVTFTFETPAARNVTVGLMGISTLSDAFVEIRTADEVGPILQKFDGLGENSIQNITIEQAAVESIAIHVSCSGAIRFICFGFDDVGL